VSRGDPDLVERIWAGDATLWSGADEREWLGWLDEPFRMRDQANKLLRRVSAAVADGVEGVVLMGMGGSSLAPEVLHRWFEANTFHVLDTTHPRAIRALEQRLDLSRTLFIASSKSGSTLETRLAAEFFWQRAPRGEQWLAITDPGSALEQLARERGFADVFSGEPSIGGRYSALSPFGMVPAALVGADLERLADGACAMAEACRLEHGNPGLELGLSLGEGWAEGRDKICVPAGGGFGLWVEQLIAESTGKQGRGLVPVPGELGEGADRQLNALRLEDPYDLGGEFYRWEFATAVAATFLKSNPFDQPDVQAAKDRTNAVLASGDVTLSPHGSVAGLLAQAQPGDYVCIQAFVEETPEAVRRLDALAATAGDQTGCVVTCGFGPRYLHSTGQLHKGGPASGLFLQVVEEYGPELEIPGSEFGFARLIRAQAAGDFESLRERGRRIARVELEQLA
jgi:transaldolase / glucose-6-phosphate isomerase